MTQESINPETSSADVEQQAAGETPEVTEEVFVRRYNACR